MKRSVPVQIAGQRFVLRSEADDDQVKEVAAYVDRRIKEVQKHTRTADTQSLAILAALQITEELFAQRRATGDLKKRVRDKSQALLTFLERAARV